MASIVLHFGCVRNTFLYTHQNLQIVQQVQPNNFSTDSVSNFTKDTFLATTATANLHQTPLAKGKYQTFGNGNRLGISLLKEENSKHVLVKNKHLLKNKDNWRPDYLGAGTLLLTIATLFLVISTILFWLSAALFLVSIYFLIRSKTWLAFIPFLLFIGGILGYIFIHPIFLLISLALLGVVFFLFNKREKKAEAESNLSKTEKEIVREKLRTKLIVLQILGILTVVFTAAALFWLIFALVEFSAGGTFAALILYAGVIFAIPSIILFFIWLYYRKQYRRKKAAQQ